MAEKKNFFKSGYFKASLILVILLVLCCGLLAVLSDLLAVSNEERVSRVISSIYGKTVEYEEVEVDFEETDFAKIECIYKLEDGNLLYQSTGKQGYKGGSVTLWVVVKTENGTPTKLDKIVYASNVSQTLMGQFGGAFYQKYTTISLEKIKQGKHFDVTAGEDIQNVASGATKSSNAMNNAVNAVIDHAFSGGNA